MNPNCDRHSNDPRPLEPERPPFCRGPTGRYLIVDPKRRLAPQISDRLRPDFLPYVRAAISDPPRDAISSEGGV